MQQTDEQLIAAVRQGNSEAMDALLDRYKNVVKKRARAMFLIGGEHDDLLQEGMIGLYKAIRDYKPEKGAGFATFANLCISRQLYTAIKLSNTMKNQPLNDYVSFEDNEHEEQSGEHYILGVYGRENSSNPEELLLEQENMEMLTEYVKKVLSPFELEVLEVYLEEESYAKVAKRMECSLKVIDNALQRIRKKLAEIRL
ncbi:MAG: sigma-70 family RNA polymerase sigma factor [Lachnospiraceae bacterium]|nr:sigma-70 family RNA polymerase sigma factor [Lachnospiraceae bacterium]